MKNRFTFSLQYTLLAIALFFVGGYQATAQTTNNQTIVSKCYNGPTVNFSNTTGTLLPSVNFAPGVDIPLGHKIVDVTIEIVWSKTDDGSCTAITGQTTDLSHVGFQISGPSGGTRYLATSNATGPFPISGPTTNSFAGTFPGATTGVVRDTIVFKHGATSLVPPPTLPNFPTRDTVAPNGDPLDFYCGLDPYGNWSIGGIDDAPTAGPQLCIHSYCVTLTTCDHDTLVASCKANPTVALDPVLGNHTITFDDIDSISDVSCMLKSMTFSPSVVNCANLLAPVAVTMTLRDHLDSVASCVSLVTVIDTTPPTITGCFDPANPLGSVWGDSYLDVNGNDTIDASLVVMNDNCTPSMLINKTIRPLTGGAWGPSVSVNCATGLNQFWVRGIDTEGNMDSCIILVNLIDTFPPTAVCGTTTAYVGNNGNASFSVAPITVDGGSFDVCPPIVNRWIGSQGATNPVYTCADIGADTVTLVVSDASGNIATCDSAIIIVVDTTAPTAVCQPATVYLNTSGNAVVTAAMINNNSIDSCGIDSINVNGAASVTFGCAAVGTPQTVMLYVFDGSGNVDSCQATVTVLDTIAPTAICRNFTVYTNTLGIATVVADSLNNNSVDLCTGNNLSFQIAGNPTATFNCASITSNPNAVTLTVLDAYGNASTCISNVTVLDTVDPTANCTNPTVYLNNAGVATVTAAELSAGSTDNCSVVDSSVNVLGVNATNFNCTAIFTPQPTTLIVEDASGNTGSCIANVNVLDTVNPVALCQANYTATLDATGNATVTPINIDNGSTDNCGLVEYLINGFASQTYTCADIGSLGAVLTVRDSSGNIATCNSTITVVDNTPPTASCQITNVYLNAVGTVAITANNVLATPPTGDNCGAVTAAFAGNISNIIYDCDSIGTRTVNVVVTDASNNTATCQTSVIVQDTVDPIASCRPVPFQVQLDASGNGFVTPADVDNNSSDVCGVADMFVNGVDTFFYTCANLGNTAVTLSVLDASGNQSTCIAQVIVNDPIPPTANCQNTTVYLDASGLATIFPADINNGSTDNCSVTATINGLPSFSFNCNQIGINTVQLVVSDLSNNSSQCPANVTVLDTMTPVANCITPATLNVYLDNTCFASIPAATLNNNSTDNCSASLSYTVGGLPNATFTSANLLTNPNPVILQVQDGSGNNTTCATSVIVRDTIKPNVVCRPDTVQLNALGSAVVLPANINNNSSDNCSNVGLTINGGPFVNMTCANIGLNTVTLTGTDGVGNVDSCITTVLVQDVTAPNASCNATATVVLDPVLSSGTLNVVDVDMGSSDNCGIASYTLSRTNFTCNDIANNPFVVTMVIADASGNLDSCTTQVTVVDVVPPIANCVPGPVNLSLVGATVSTTAAAINNNSTDNCAIASFALSQSTFTCNDIGNNTVTLTVTDSSGNANTCNVIVNVSDNVSPTPICSSPTLLLPASGLVSVAAVDLGAASFDNCAIDTILANGADSVTFNCNDIGTNTVTVFVQDPSGSAANCVSTVTIADSLDPTAICVTTPIDLYLDPTGNAGLTTGMVDNGSTDNCSIGALTLSQTNYTCADINSSPNTVTLTVTDGSGNTDNCTAQINVIDTVAPTVLCQPVTVNIHLSPGGLATVTAPMFDAGSTDACGAIAFTFTGAPNPVSCADLGVNPIVLTGTDLYGNTASCNTTLTVLDTVQPALTCNNITVNLDAFGNVTVDSATAGLYTVSDACGDPTILLNNTTSIPYTCADVGLDTITILATDGSGNTATCNAVLTIADVTPPTVTCSIDTQYLPVSGVLPIDPAWVLNSVIEACGVDTVFTTPATLTCANVGTFNPITVTVVDVNGNQSSCNGNISVFDTLPPTMVCRDTSICLNGGFVSVSAADIDGGTTDACGLSVIQTINNTNNVIYTCADLGVQTAILQMQDVNGNIDTCHAQVTVQDCQSPTVICQSNYTAYVQSNGFVSVQAIDLDFGSTDLCGIDSTTFQINGQDSIVYTCNSINTPDTVNFTVADLYGNVDTCVAIITIQDTISPIANCVSSVTAVLSAGQGIAIIPAFNLNNLANPSSDNCLLSTYLINGQVQDTFDCSMVGTQTATLTVVDQSGNQGSCQATVNVQDITPPTATCQFTTNLSLDQTGQAVIPAASLVISSSDNCGIASITANGLDSLLFDCSDLGNNLISVVVTDSSGNPFTCSAIVNISDAIPPVAICPTNPVPAYLTSNSVVWVTAQQIDSSSTDNCGIASYFINSADSILYNCTQIGTNQTAVLTVIDSSGNQATCNATIEVLDTIPPVAQCRDITVQLSPSGVISVAATAIDSFSFDNCGVNSFLINNQLADTFNCSNVGAPNTAVLTVVDLYGNTSFCTSQITVVDVTAPNIQCPPTPIDFYLGANGTVTVDPRDVANASDTCSILFWFIDGLPDSTFDCSHVGSPHLVTIRVEDPSGNFAQCNAIINILDTIPPTNFCQNISVALDSTGVVDVTGSDIAAGFNFDNCAIVDTLINGQPSITYTCDSLPAGVAQVTLNAVLTLTDPSGNIGTCIAQVNLQDNIAPVANCNDTVTVQLNQDGIVEVQAITLDNGSTDACTPLEYLINGLPVDTFNCSEVGYQAAVLRVVDASGNVSNCISTLEILDNIPPQVQCNDFDLYLSTTGSVTLFADSINNGSVDNCGILSVAFNNGNNSISYNCSDTGVHVVTLVVTDIYGNMDSCTAQITVRDTIAPNLLCNSTTINLTMSGPVTLSVTGGSYNVVSSVSDVCALDTVFVSPQNISCNDLGDVIFTVTAIDASGNIATCQDTATVYLERPMVVVPSQDTVLCEGDTLPLSATIPINGFNYDYEWSGPNGIITSDPTTTDTVVTNIGVNDEGYYIFTIYPNGNNGCPALDSVYLDVNEVQPPVLAGMPPCEGDTGVIYLTNATTYVGTNITYNWYFNGALISNSADSLIIPNMTASDSGTYSMAITVDACYDSSAVGFTFDVLDLPTAPVPTANIPCEGDTLTLFNNAAGFTYDWSGPAGFTSTLPEPIEANVSQANAGTYTLTITDANNCSNTGSVTVTIKETPVQPDLMYDQPLCPGDLLMLYDSTVYSGTPLLYFWESPTGNIDTTIIGNHAIATAPAGDYMLTVSMDGCLSVGDTQNVVYEPIPNGSDDAFSIPFRDSLIDANIIVNDGGTLSDYTITIVDSTNGGAVQNNGDGTISYWPRSGFFGTDTLRYALCDIDCPNSCDIIEVQIEVVTDFECFIPQGISPNGDGINDEVIVRCKHNYPNAQMQVFSRWGTLVYDGEPTGWNGQFQGKDLPDGTYFYILKLNDTTYTGTEKDSSIGRDGDQYTGYIMLQR